MRSKLTKLDGFFIALILVLSFKSLSSYYYEEYIEAIYLLLWTIIFTLGIFVDKMIQTDLLRRKSR